MALIGSLYIIRNNINSYVYIGKTYNTLNRRFNQHKSCAYMQNKNGEGYLINDKFHRAIRELGKDNFYIQKLGSYEQYELEQKEIEYISKYDSYNNGYNSTLGGDTGRTKIISEELEAQIIYLHSCGYSNNDIKDILDVTNYTVRLVLKSNGIESICKFDDKANKEETPVFGVQRKTGHIVGYKNEYVAAEDIYNSGLSVQNKYYIKNDILRSISTSNYGVAGYIWFRKYYEALNYSNGLKDKDRYTNIDIIGTRLVKSMLICKKRDIIRNRRRQIKRLRNEELDKYSYKYPPSADELAYLILNHTVNSIAMHYNVSFATLKNLLHKYKLPCTKEEIRIYRSEHEG